MAEVVNLNKARKAKARTTAKSQAVENRIRFGATSADKAARKAEADKANRKLEGARRGDPED